MYPPHLTQPMAAQLTDNGFQACHSVEEVDQLMAPDQGTVLMVVNSVCGCAAGAARPGVIDAVKTSDKLPSKLATVFAGVDVDATKKARAYMLPYPPSSPSIGLFKDGKLVHMIERHHIEGRPAEMIAANLKAAFAEHC